jgi:transposase InsO family protein
MRQLGLAARRKRAFKHTTLTDPALPVAPNLLQRQFEVDQLATVWVSDITYIRVGAGWAYLTVVLDLADRMVVGWSLSRDMSAEQTVQAALLNACRNRTPCRRLIFHSDRGAQYGAEDFRKLLKRYDMRQSMSAKGDCWDNAVAESFFKTIKVEALNDQRFSSFDQVYSEVFAYIDGWYNTQRIHTTLGGKTPLEMAIIKSKNLKLA